MTAPHCKIYSNWGGGGGAFSISPPVLTYMEACCNFISTKHTRSDISFKKITPNKLTFLEDFVLYECVCLR
jgi:hypothetical protein